MASSRDLEQGLSRRFHGVGLWSKIVALKNHMGRNGFEDAAESMGPKQPASAPDSDPSGENETANAKYTEAESEAACGKLWSIYVGEAEKYDKRLVESWKGDMDGMLIFSGLYSASLTAFLVESYTTLQPDSGVTNTALLAQISRQLAGTSNGTVLPFQDPAPFHPTTAALVCNALWFLSLALSLTCALLATLVEQWAREFIHKSSSFTNPTRRVRIHSFLYLGLQRFGMYTVVDVIPLLLHTSLIIFFTGLVFFLLPVNPLLVHLMSFVLAAFLVIYTILTALPLVFLESPYQTPLSKGMWRFWQLSTALLTKKLSKNIHPVSGIFPRLTMTQAMERRSQKNPKIRDQHAVQWTVVALTDDSELIPFIEAIPDIVHGAKGFHRANDYLLHPLLYTQEPHLAIWPRVVNLLRSSAIIPSADPLRIPRLTICFRAIWALAKSRGPQPVSVSSFPTTFYFDRETFKALEDLNLDSYYTISVRAAIRHKLLADLKALCQHVLSCLDGWETASLPSRRISLQLIRSAVDTTLEEGEFYAVHLDIESQEIFRALQASYTLNIEPGRDARNALASRPVTTKPEDLKRVKEEIQQAIQNQIQTLASLRDVFRSDTGWANAHLAPLSWYLRDSLNAGFCPYEFDLTVLDFLDSIAFAQRSAHVHLALGSLTSISSYSPEMDKLAKMVFRLIRFVDAKQFGRAVNGIYHYLLNRNVDENTLRYLLDDEYLIYLMTAIIKDVDNGPSHACLRTIWLLAAYILSQNLDEQSNLFKGFMTFTSDLCRELPVHAIPKSDFHPFVLALVQWVGINALSDEIAQEDAYPSSTGDVREVAVNFRTHPLLLAFFPNNVEEVNSNWSLLQIYSDLGNQVTEISLILVAEFLRAYLTNSRLFSVGQVLISGLERQCRTNFEGVVSAESQRSFASGILSLIKRLEDNADRELEEVVKNAWSASYYWSWMDDPTCASILLESLTLCDTIGWTDKNPDSQSYIQNLRLRCIKLV